MALNTKQNRLANPTVLLIGKTIFEFQIVQLSYASKAQFGILTGSMYVGIFLFGIALIALWFMEDTFHKDLDYLEA